MHPPTSGFKGIIVDGYSRTFRASLTMVLIFLALAAVTVAGALGAALLRQPVHCALSLIVAFLGMAGLFLQLDSQFIGLAQVLVYVGAVGILIVFAILLTHSGEVQAGSSRFSRSWWAGLLVAVLVSGTFAGAVWGSRQMRREAPPPPQATVKDIGVQMMRGEAQGPVRAHYVLPLEVAGLLFTAALIGATLIALPERRDS